MADAQLVNDKGKTAFNKNAARMVPMVTGVSNVSHRALRESFHTSKSHCIYKGCLGFSGMCTRECWVAKAPLTSLW